MTRTNVLRVVIWLIVVLGIGACTRLNHFQPLWSSSAESILSRIGQNYLQYELGADGKTWIAKCYCGHPINAGDIPQFAKDAVVAVEDRRFYLHNGVDPIGILRALIRRLTGGRLEGGSTISQQLVKFQLLSLEASLPRKVHELALVFQYEAGLSKDEILATYLNRAVYTYRDNQPVVGIEYAARVFYHKHASDLTLYEAAQLAGVLQNPSKYNPVSNPTKARQRTEVVLAAMVEQGFITGAQRDAALAEGPSMGAVDPIEYDFRYFEQVVRSELAAKYPHIQVNGKLRVFVAFDPVAQYWADYAVQSARRQTHLSDLEGAVVSLDQMGRIVALSGGTNFADHQTNRATSTWRQPASCFKLFPYLVALERGLGVDDFIDGSRPQDLTWGRNPSGVYPKRLSMLDAFARSINSAARHLTEMVGAAEVVAIARRLGVTAPLDDGEYLALGVTEVSLLEMTQAYASIGRDGWAVEAHAIIGISDTSGRLLAGEVIIQERVLSIEVAQSARRLLREVVWHGTARGGANISVEAAGKTGTGEGGRDAWFIGYTETLTTGIWLGRDDFAPVPGLTGADVARLWGSYNFNIQASR